MLFVSMPNALDVSFSQFWALYPRREAKKDARKAWEQLRPSDAVVTEILTALAWQVEKPQWLKDNGQYIPLPASWIRGERWTDEKPVTSSQPRRLGERLQEEPCPICGYPEPAYHSKTMCNQLWLEQQKPPAPAETA